MGVGGQCHAPTTVALGKRPGTNCQGGWVGPRAVCTGVENSAPIGIGSLDCPAFSVLLY